MFTKAFLNPEGRRHGRMCYLLASTGGWFSLVIDSRLRRILQKNTHVLIPRRVAGSEYSRAREDKLYNIKVNGKLNVAKIA